MHSFCCRRRRSVTSCLLQSCILSVHLSVPIRALPIPWTVRCGRNLRYHLSAVQAKRGEAGAAPALGMPALPAEQNKSPGAAARAARQRKRKAANMPEEFDERTMRMHKRMVCPSSREVPVDQTGSASHHVRSLQRSFEMLYLPLC